MGRKDSVTKDYMRQKEVFADIFNMFLYDGEKIIQSEELVPEDTEEFMENTKTGIIYAQNRDIFKKCISMKTKTCGYLLLGLEEQSHINYGMPVRVFVYDGGKYEVQLKEKAKVNRERSKKSERAMT